MEQIKMVCEFKDDNITGDTCQPKLTQEQIDEMIKKIAKERTKAGKPNTIKTVISDGTEWKQNELLVLKRVKNYLKSKIPR